MDASADLRIVRLEEQYKNDGYAVFFKCLELVGDQGSGGKLKFEDFPKSLIAKRCNIAEDKLDDILSYMGRSGLCSSSHLSKGILYFPKLVSRADDYAKRLRRKSVQHSDIDTEERKEVTAYYIQQKGYSTVGWTSGDWSRLGKGIKDLFIRSNNNKQQCIEAISWISGKNYEWTLETLIRKYPDFLKIQKSDTVKELEKIDEENRHGKGNKEETSAVA